MQIDNYLIPNSKGVTRGAVNSKAMTPNYEGKCPSNAHRPSKTPPPLPFLPRGIYKIPQGYCNHARGRPAGQPAYVILDDTR